MVPVFANLVRSKRLIQIQITAPSLNGACFCKGGTKQKIDTNPNNGSEPKKRLFLQNRYEIKIYRIDTTAVYFRVIYVYKNKDAFLEPFVYLQKRECVWTNKRIQLMKCRRTARLRHRRKRKPHKIRMQTAVHRARIRETRTDIPHRTLPRAVCKIRTHKILTRTAHSKATVKIPMRKIKILTETDRIRMGSTVRATDNIRTVSRRTARRRHLITGSVTQAAGMCR